MSTIIVAVVIYYLAGYREPDLDTYAYGTSDSKRILYLVLHPEDTEGNEESKGDKLINTAQGSSTLTHFLRKRSPLSPPLWKAHSFLIQSSFLPHSLSFIQCLNTNDFSQLYHFPEPGIAFFLFFPTSSKSRLVACSQEGSLRWAEGGSQSPLFPTTLLPSNLQHECVFTQ